MLVAFTVPDNVLDVGYIGVFTSHGFKSRLLDGVDNGIIFKLHGHAHLLVQKGGHHGVGVCDHVDLQMVNIGLSFDPVVLVLGVSNLVVGNKGFQDKWTGSHCMGLAPFHPVLLIGFLGADIDVPYYIVPVIGPLIVLDLYGQVIHHFYFLGRPDLTCLAVVNVLLDVPCNYLPVTHRAIVEFNAVP